MATQITVDLDKCQGHGKCYLLAPTMFAPIDDDDWGRAEVLHASLGPADDPDGSLLQQAQIGLRACPEHAIAVVESADAATTPSTSAPEPSNS